MADSVDVQIELMGQGYVDGLVGQLPYQMGEISAQQLFRYQRKNTAGDSVVLTTHMLEILRVPITLPPVAVDHNILGNLKILGYVLFSIVAISSIMATAWVWFNRETHVVRVAQPVFLYMIGAGTLILGSAIIPLTFDDESGGSQQASDIACRALPWLISIGFSTAFAALFSKTWRIFRLVKAAHRFQRVTVTVRDVMGPFALLILANVITLICWTFISPLEYVRSPSLGTDDWNRVISTFGRCTSASDAAGGPVPYLTILLVVNVGVLVVANVYAFRSRHILTEYSESRYIALLNGSMLEAALIGLPILSLVYEQPRPFFIVMSFFIFVICMAIVGFIFVPKYYGYLDWQQKQQDKENEKLSKHSSQDKRIPNEQQKANAAEALPPPGRIRLSVVPSGRRESGRGSSSSLVSRQTLRELRGSLASMSIGEKKKLTSFLASMSKLDEIDRFELEDAMDTMISESTEARREESGDEVGEASKETGDDVPSD